MAKIPSPTELRAMTLEDLRGDLSSTERELAHVRMEIIFNKEKNTSKQRTLRRHVAQILTVLNEKKPMRPRKPTNSSSVSSDSLVSSKKGKKPLSKAKVDTTLPTRS